MTIRRISLSTLGLLTALCVNFATAQLATAQDTPKAEQRGGNPAPPKGPPLERRDNPDAAGPRNPADPDGAGPRRGSQDGPDGDRFRPGRPLPNANPGPGPRRNPGDPNNPNDFEGRPDGIRRPAVPGGPAFGGRQGAGHPNLEEMKETDPEMFELLQADMKLDQQTRDEADEYRRAKPSDKEEIKARLAKSVEEHYNVRQKRRELELRRMEEQLTRLRDSVKKRNDEKDAMIKQRISQLVGNPDDGF